MYYTIYGRLEVADIHVRIIVVQLLDVIITSLFKSIPFFLIVTNLMLFIVLKIVSCY